MTDSTKPVIETTSTIPASLRQAAATRSATERRSKLLSPPGTAAPPDDRFTSKGRVRTLLAYDAGHRPPPAPSGGADILAQGLGVDDTVSAVAGRFVDIVEDSAWVRIATARGVRRVLEWLSEFEGTTWEERWLASGADATPRTWIHVVAPDMSSAWYGQLTMGAHRLIQARVLRPSYAWMLDQRSDARWLRRFLEINDSARLAELRQLPAYRRALPRHQFDAEHGLARVVIRTGKHLAELRGEELLHYADVVKTSGRHRREHLAWELLVALGIFVDEPPTLRSAWSAKGNTRQHSVATLVDRYGIPPSGVRDLLVDYLSELKPGLDYASLEGLAYRLARLFWWEVVQINPDQADLRLSPQTATAWRERLALTTDGRPRRETHSVLFAIRGLYRDLAEWAHDEPARWAPWVAPCPVPRSQTRAASKDRRRQQARTQARTRALTPLLPTLVADVERHKEWAQRLLAAAESCDDAEPFTVDDVRFSRADPQVSHPHNSRSRTWVLVLDDRPGARRVPLSDGRVDVTRLEEDAFWAWALVETLRHTGIRIEELLELTQLSLRHYTAPTTGTLVPLLHVAPSKTDVERLIPMTPELVTVLLAVQRRIKDPEGQIPLSVRYDPHEKIHGDPLPHLFARAVGARHEVVSMHYVRTVLNAAAERIDLHDGGEPVRFTPHDFRRLFTTELVGSGLPLHIVASLLGHLNMETTRGYTAVFPEQVIAAHEAFIERRRQLRPDGEMRSANGEEWAEFEEHFLLRRVALGECHRPYGTPCVHEHACTRCRFLRVDPAQLGRIEEMESNTEARLAEAQGKAWLGEVAALEESLIHLRRRRTEAQSQAAAVSAAAQGR